MKDSTQRKKVLEDMLATQNFEHLTVFEDSSKWNEMPTDERELLGLLYVMQGEKQLNEGDNKVLDSFKLANLVAPNCPNIMYRQALAFAKETHNLYCLKAATKIFEKTLEIKPDFFDAWHGWANTCALMAMHTNVEEDFTTALEKFNKAEGMIEAGNIDCQAALYRDWGVLWFHYGKYSGEAVDFRNALKCYKKAVSMGVNTFDLWNDYGNCLTEIASLLKKPDLILESVNMYWRSVRLKKDFFEGWLNMAVALKVIYELQPVESYYKLANEGFEQASKLDPENGTLWVKWGQLQAFKGKTFKEIEVLRESIQKFEAANICESNHPVILGSWAESLLYLGEWTEDLSQIKEAEAKVVKGLEIQKDHPRLWCLYGNCLTELGRYFDEEDYYVQALEKYHYALTLTKKDPIIWHGMAMAYLALGQLNQDLKLIDKANHCCRHMIEAGGHSQAQYWNDWGVVLMKIGTITDEKEVVQEALSRFEQALRIRSHYQKHEQVETEWLYNYGCALDFLGDFDDDIAYLERAIQVLRKVVDLDPTFHHAYYNLAIAYAHYGDLTSEPDVFRESLKYLEAYVCLEPEDDYAWNEWGLTLIDLSLLINDPVRKSEVEDLLREAETKFVHARSLGSHASLYHLACLYAVRGDRENAIVLLYQAKEAGSLPPAEELITNHWLETVRYTPEFQRLVLES